MQIDRKLTTENILPLAEYAATRAEHKRRVGAKKRIRRVAVGPFVNFYFEDYDTMWLQVQEMLHIEKGGAAQLEDELAAYNPLIPQGRELVATFMIEIEDPVRRANTLAGLGGIEETAFLEVAGEKIAAAPEEDQDRTNANGKASAVQFVHFPFTPAQVEAFKKPNASVIVGLSHPAYGHMAVMPEEVRAELSKDFA